MSISNDIKKTVTQDWLNAFPQLTAYAQHKIYKIVGPVVIGIEIYKLRTGDYRPLLVIYPLWKNDPVACMNEPLVYDEIFKQNGRQFNIPYMNHTAYLSEAVACMKDQVAIPFDQDVTIKALFKMIEGLFDGILTRVSPVQQAKLCEFMYNAALYLQAYTLIDAILPEIFKRAETWGPAQFDWKYGSFEKWISDLQARTSEDLIKQVELNKQDKKLSKLKQSSLIL